MKLELEIRDDEPTVDEFRRLMVSGLLDLAKHSDPDDFRGFLIGGVLANVVGNMPDDYWRKFMKLEICTEPGCDCHVIRETMLAALDALRDDHKKHSPPTSPQPA